MVKKLTSIALNEIGTHEADDGDDKYIKWYGGFALTVAWCAIFVSWCANKAGISTKIIPKFASCDAGLKWFKDRGQYELGKAYGGKYVPKPGDIIFYSSRYTQKDSDHVGIVESVGNSVVNTIEGNTSDAVRRRSRQLSGKYILGYGVPAYTNTFDFKGWVKRLQAETGCNKVNGITGPETLGNTPTLKRKSKGPVVGLVQEYMKANGYDIGTYGPNKDGIDCSFGPAFEKVIMKYQKDMGHPKPDGEITGKQRTWKYMLKM